ncbi:unnamed protein product [Linum tenue]|uniref:Uncharacterized protein n=1 Tax=Linum tenue TaxID=586396 RepID=A0AAV0IWD9_9ROSI|nr:unnamed protein product [Linum tenue]
MAMMKLAVTIKESSLVKPAEATWTGRMPLSEFDMTGTITHVDLLYFYDNKSSTTCFPQNDAASDLLKDSLSRTLVTFYPLAGRLHPKGGGRLELNCNGSGAQFMEAEAETTSLDELSSWFVGADVSGNKPRPSGAEFMPLVPAVDYGSVPIGEWPLLLVQLTRFGCGGFCLGFNMCHAVADGLAAMHFFHEWARVARGEGVGGVGPVFDRRVLRGGQPPLARQPAFDPAQFDHPPVLLHDNDNGIGNAATRLKLTKTQVHTLKEMANKDLSSTLTTRPYTTYETLTAHIWRCACKARKLEPNQLTAVGVCVDARRRVDPPLPDGYFGDAVIDVKATGLSGDLVARPLGYAAGRVREATEKADSEFLWSAIEYMKNQPDLTKFQDFFEEGGEEEEEEPFFGIPNLNVTSWLRLSMLGLDFGFGKEVRMDTTFDFDGDTTLSGSQDGDGSVVISICLRSDHIDGFERCFYDDIFI